MNNRVALSLMLMTTAVAQAPELRVAPAARPGERIDHLLVGVAGDPFATMLSSGGGPVSLLDQTIYLDPRLVIVIDSGVLGLGGFRAGSLATPTTAPIDVPIYFQSVILDRVASLRASDGESSTLYRSRHVIVQDFADPVAQGLVGSYDADVRGRLQAGRTQTRTHDVVPLVGVAFGSSVTGPFAPFGVRQQSVYRATDIGADGTPEFLTAIRWQPHRFTPVQFDAGMQLDLRAAHSHVVPDYSIDPFSALPRFPQSGLGTTFANNVRQGDPISPVYQGPYTIDPVQRRADGYMPFPVLQRPFAYNGVSSLLIEYRTTGTHNGTNGFQTYLMVQSSSLPNARAIAAGTATAPIDPQTVTAATSADCVWFELQLEFARMESVATSPWLAAPTAAPNFSAPIVSQSVPHGANVRLEFRGSRTANGGSPTTWINDIDLIDGYAFLQYRVSFQNPMGSDLRASVDQIVIPVD